MILLHVFICTQATAQLSIGKKLPGEVKIVNNSKYILSGPASIEKARTIIYEEHTYDVILNLNGTIKYITTTDKTFITPDGIKVGMPFRQIKSNLSDTTGHVYPGWGKWYVTKSGWKVGFDFEHAVSDTSIVKFIFKN